MNRKIIHGHLDAYAETGTEGVIWSIYEDGKTGYAGLHFLEDGDKIRIYNKTKHNDSDTSVGLVLFEGVIDLDNYANVHPYPWVLKPHERRSCAFYEDENANFKDDLGECPGHDAAWARKHGLGQSASCGYWVHGIQRGYDADAWGRMFFDELRAELTKAK